MTLKILYFFVINDYSLKFASIKHCTHGIFVHIVLTKTEYIEILFFQTTLHFWGATTGHHKLSPCLIL